MAAEPRSTELPDGPPTASGRATAERAGIRRGHCDAPEVAYRCGACDEEFVAEPGPAPCPRCQSVGDHDAIGRVGGDGDGG